MSQHDSTPPLVVRLFGEHWDDLDSRPDCWNRWFGDDSDTEGDATNPNAARDSAEALAKEAKKGAKNLTDQSWIKQRLDEEVYRYVVEDLGLKDNGALTWRRTKLLLIASIFGILAQFPYLVPPETTSLQALSLVLIVAYFAFYIYGQAISFLVPWNAIFESLPSAPSSKDAFFIESDMRKHDVDYVVCVRSKFDRSIVEKGIVPGTILFTAGGRLTPEPLHREIQELLTKIKARSTKL